VQGSAGVGTVDGAMSVQLNHTIVYAADAHASASYLAEMLDRPAPVHAGPFWQVDLDNGVSLDYASAAEEEIETLPHLHLAFLVNEEQFTATYGRITGRGVTHWADPAQRGVNEINTHDGGRGVYWQDPDGHFLEIITVPYGGWPKS
jgi:catechol 2,3-dioxygenase-like lactoylglutathione lyase family enzyme